MVARAGGPPAARALGSKSGACSRQSDGSQGGVKVILELSNKNSSPSGGFQSGDPKERKCTEIVGPDSENNAVIRVNLSCNPL